MKNARLTKTALSFTRWIGSADSIVLHTVLFTLSFLAAVMGLIPFDRMLLILTTIVSLEAIYLAIFIQMSLNNTRESLEEVEHDIDEIQEDVEEIQKDVDEIQEDVDELQEDVEDISEEEKQDEVRKEAQKKTLSDIQSELQRLIQDIETLRR